MTAPATTGSDVSFSSLGLAEPLLRALAAKNYATPTPIQARSIPHLLQGRDLLGIAQTGTGKTAAFALPMLQRLHQANRRAKPKLPRALVLAPTRELATQIADSCQAYGQHLHIRGTVVFGGVGQNPQVQALARGIDIVIATPGRLLDLIQQRHVSLAEVEILVLDEADRMLDMGFLPDVKRILATLPSARQSLLFSATMPSDITALASRYLRDPLRVEVTPPAATADRIEQSVYFVSKAQKRTLLAQLLADPQFVRTLVFTRTKHGADRVVKELQKANIQSHAIHGNKSQNARERALDAFRDGKAHVLVATDIAARGIDVPDITHVVNYDLPNIPESYVHRIGRTARAGRDGIAISFCDEEEREYLRDIEKLIRKRVPVAGNQLKASAQAAAAQRQEQRQTSQSQPKAPAPARGPSHNPWEQPALVGRSQPAPARDQDAFGAQIDGDDEVRDGDRTPRPPEPRQRQRPTPRPAPGPYAPSPRAPQQSGPRPPRHERNQQQRGHGGSRPAMPNAVAPEQRRQRQEHEGSRRPPQDDRPRQGPSRPHDSGHGGRPQGGRPQGGGSHGGGSRHPRR
ncbi:MAG: DEAD/DEAH box helicase [Planctomycetota bacterium]